ncbi:MAG: triphosphoribosyl-dephospho-CoA synthase [Methanocorpusculum sp.]|jgi:triphosphoribosyl-dephospho-CoA synthase|nr:triphosphoribosyl-dephospho-CoA synthase [Methanocorpusculum sp.]
MPELSLAETAELAMLLEVSTNIKPGNIDRFHDYEDTKLQHFLASAVLSRGVFERVPDLTIGEAMYAAVKKTSGYSGGNTHFGAFILLLPLIKGHGIIGARDAVKQTTVEDAVLFYRAFGETQVRVNKGDEMDINDPASLDMLRAKQMTMLDVMAYSSENDMVAREWTNGFALTRKAADLLKQKDGLGNIQQMFITMMAEYPDTFIGKKFGRDISLAVMHEAQLVLSGKIPIGEFDEQCIRNGVNPGSLADICIAGIFTALLEGWKWDC